MMNKKGFTLVELLAVISILGVVIIFAIPTMLDAMSKSKKVLDGYTEDGIKDGAKMYITDFDLGTKKYIYNEDTPWTSPYSDETYNKGDKMSTYDFRLYVDSKNGIEVSIVDLVKGGYYNKGCDYETKIKDCNIKQECMVKAKIKTKQNDAGYLETSGYEAELISGCEKR